MTDEKKTDRPTEKPEAKVELQDLEAAPDGVRGGGFVLPDGTKITMKTAYATAYVEDYTPPQS